jgi:hypothetical protein
MSALLPFTFDKEMCKIELKAFGNLLKMNSELSEQKQILPFFKKSKNLAAFIGFMHSNINKFDRLSSEFSFYGQFTCDLITGDSNSKSFCIVEFEDSREKSVFTKQTRQHPYWSRRYEVGFGQLLDWIWTISDFRNTPSFTDTFGDVNADFIALLIIGRSKFIKEKTDKRRFSWRSRNVSINGVKVTCMTYDELYQAICKRITALDSDEANDFEEIEE